MMFKSQISLRSSLQAIPYRHHDTILKTLPNKIIIPTFLACGFKNIQCRTDAMRIINGYHFGKLKLTVISEMTDARVIEYTLSSHDGDFKKEIGSHLSKRFSEFDMSTLGLAFDSVLMG